MDRRGFLRLLGGAAVASATTYVLPPLGGWRQGQSGLYASNGHGNSMWVRKTPTEIMADVNAMLAETWNNAALPDHVYGLDPLTCKVLGDWALKAEHLWFTPGGIDSTSPMKIGRAADVQLYR
jgi:hypothetical protein